MNDKPPFVFHDLQDSQIFALAQSAGRSGYDVHGTLPSIENAPWVKASRYTNEYYEIPSLGNINMGLYALALKKQSVQGVFVPVVDDIADLLASYAPLLRKNGLSFLTVTPDKIERSHNINLQHTTGKIRIPPTAYCSTDEMLTTASEIGFPVILKSFRDGLIHFACKQDMINWLNSGSEAEYPFHLHQSVQRYIPGETKKMASVLLLFDENSRPVRGFTLRRVRVANTTFGPFGETVAAQAEWIPDLYKAAEELLTTIGWVGFAEVECKQDDKGNWNLIEINPRLSGWTCMAEQDGAGFLDAYYHLNTKETQLEPSCQQKSATSYTRIIASSLHQPDWANFNRQTYKSMLKFPNEICFGAWDKHDPKANHAWASLMLQRFKTEKLTPAQ